MRKHFNQKGAATLIISVLLMLSISMIAIFSANYSIFQQKISANMNRRQQAFAAAEAGLEFGINYLNQNSAVILANPVNGYIPSYTSGSTTNVTLGNGSKFSITYSNPVANNYNLILVTSTGTNDDGTATQTISQQVEYGSLLYVLPQNTIINIGNTGLRDNSIVTNNQGNTTIQSGSYTNIHDSAYTKLSTGPSSTSSVIGNDIQQNIVSLANKSSNDFFATYFGITMNAAKSKANYTYSNQSDYTSSLNGKSGTTIWIDQTSGTANITGTATIGTAQQPVLLIINGNLYAASNTSITGLVVILGNGTSTTDQNAQITGGLLSLGSIRTRSSSGITFDKSILSTLQKTINTYFAKVPGTWKDF